MTYILVDIYTFSPFSMTYYQWNALLIAPLPNLFFGNYNCLLLDLQRPFCLVTPSPTLLSIDLHDGSDRDLIGTQCSLMCPSFARQTTFGHPTVLAHPAIFHAFLSRDRFLELRHTKPSQFQAILELFDFAIAYFLHFVLIVFQFPFIIASTSSFLFCSEKYCVSTLPFLVDFPTSFHWSSPLTIIAYHLRLSCYPCAQPTQSTISCNPMVREIHTHNAHRILN